MIGIIILFSALSITIALTNINETLKRIKDKL